MHSVSRKSNFKVTKLTHDEFMAQSCFTVGTQCEPTVPVALVAVLDFGFLLQPLFAGGDFGFLLQPLFAGGDFGFFPQPLFAGGLGSFPVEDKTR